MLLGFYEIYKENQQKEEEEKYFVKVEYEKVGFSGDKFVLESIKIFEDGRIIKSYTIGLENIRVSSRLKKEELKELINLSIDALKLQDRYDCESKCKNNRIRIKLNVKLSTGEEYKKEILICCETKEVKKLMDFIEKIKKKS